MNRKLKAIALALAAIFSMSALAASGAHANLTSSSSHTILHGIQEGSLNITGGEGFGGVTCSTVTFSGTAAGTEVETMVVQPTLSNCITVVGRKVDIVENTLSMTLTDEGIGHASGKAVTNITSEGSVVCTTTIESQTNSGSATENLEGTNGVKVKIETENLAFTTSGGFFNCGVSNGEHKNGTVEGTVRVKGQNTEGSPVAISVD